MWQAPATVLAAVFAVVLDFLFGKTPVTRVSDHKADPGVKDAFAKKVASKFGKVGLAIAALTVLCASGCSLPFALRETVYVPEGEPVRLAEDVKAKVWAKNADGEPVIGVIDLKSGWYAASLKDDEIEAAKK